MIKVQKDIVSLCGDVNCIIAEYMVITVALLKTNIPYELIEESVEHARELYDSHDFDDEELEHKAMISDLKSMFKELKDKDKAEIVKALREAMESDD